MRFTSVFTGILTVSFATVFALPIPSVSQRDSLVARNNQAVLIRRDIDFHIARHDPSDLVLRDVFDPIHARDLQARAPYVFLTPSYPYTS